MITITTKTFYPTKVTQTSGGKYRTFKDLNVIKATNNGYAQSNGDIKSKKSSPNRPSTIDATGFNCNLPVGAVVNSVTVEVKHAKHGDSNKTSCNIGAPTISLINDGKIISKTTSYAGKSYTLSKKNQAPKMEGDYKPTVFNGKAKVDVIDTSKVTPGKSVLATTATKSVNVTYDLPSRAVVNGSTFGVRVNYPTNTNTYPGQIRVWWVRIKVEYTLSTYTVKLDQIMKEGTGYNGEEYHLKCTVSRKSKTGYVPYVTITTPDGFSFIGTEDPVKTVIAPDNTGTVEQISAHVLKYTPALSAKNETGTASVELVFQVNVTYLSGMTYYEPITPFEAVESLNNTTGTHTPHITDRPAATDSESGTGSSSNGVELGGDNPYENPVYVVEGEMFQIDIARTEHNAQSGVGLASPHNKIWYATTSPSDLDSEEFEEVKEEINDNDSDWWGRYGFISEQTFTRYANDNVYTQYFKIYEQGVYQLYIFPDNSYNETDRVIYTIFVMPANLSKLGYSILKLSPEELNRLGDGYSYTLQSTLRVVTTESYVHDWTRNFRIGVFNNAIESNQTILNIPHEDGEIEPVIVDSTDYDTLSPSEILDNAEYWSNCPTTPNTYTNLECDFMYDEDYPVYIIVAGDFQEASIQGRIQFTEPCLIETDNYKEAQINGIYPSPVRNVISDDDTCVIELEPYTQTDSFVIYNFAVDENFGTTEDIAIRGVEITGNIEQADNLVLYAKLCSPTGESSQRSIIISDTNATEGDTSFNIGGAGDLWGFNILDFTNIGEWRVELFASNILEDTVANMNFNDVNVVFYTEQVIQQNINIKVENEDLSFYNCFINDVEIPPGLDTDLDFLTVNGADTNDGYRQNIKEKTINIDLELGDGCSLEQSTNNLRQLMKLLTNERDAYNKPIPKHIEFSHMPDVYFEYVMKDSPEISINITTYDVSIKLVVPSGTSFSKSPTVTNVDGVIQGLANISPSITLTPIADSIEIVEKRSNQKFSITYNSDWIGKIVEIDCEDMIIWLKENAEDTSPVNITNYGDYNNHWFKLHGEYRFEGTNCVIRTVDYFERW